MSSSILFPGLRAWRLFKNFPGTGTDFKLARIKLILSQNYSTTISKPPGDDNHEKNQDKNSSSPLSGVRVLDLSRILAGPYATMVLGDLGADIIKIEKPGSGDDTRSWGPPNVNDLSCYFICVNRNKKSLALDLKRGKEILKQLVVHSDVLIENFVPGTMEKLGIGYEDLKAVNNRLIYCSISGFGQTGEYRERGGYDVIAAALGGLMHITGPLDGEPCKVGVAITDLATGLYAHGAIMAALLQRSQTGEGQRIDCNLLSTQIAQLVNIGSNYINANMEGRRWGSAHETIVPYQAFQTKDKRWLVLGAGNNDLFKELCQRLSCEHLTADEKYSTNPLRVKNRESLLKVISTKISERTCDDWLEVFRGSKLPYSPINNMEQAFQDPQVKHNRMVRELGPYKVLGPAVNFSGSRNEPRTPPPLLGQHSRQILSSILGFDDTQLDLLASQNIIQ